MAMADSSFVAFPSPLQRPQSLLPSLTLSPLPLSHLHSRLPSRSKIFFRVSGSHGSDGPVEHGRLVEFPEKPKRGRPKKIQSSTNTVEKNDGTVGLETMQHVAAAASTGGSSNAGGKSRRGRTRKSLGLHSDADSKSSIDASLSTSERESDIGASTTESKVSASTVGTSEFGDLRLPIEARLNEDQSFSESGTPASGSLNDSSAKKKLNPWQAMIAAKIDKTLDSREDDDDDGGYLPWVEEEDPNWLDEPDDGWGFKVSEFFKEGFRVKNDKKEDNNEDDDVQKLDWDLEPDRWSAKEIDATDWTLTVFGDPSPLVVLLFERYGKRSRECYHVLRELEDAANRIWDSHRLPPRLCKINASMEVDLASALEAKEFPLLLFIRAGKLLHRQTGYYTSEDLMRMIAYFYHGAGRPSCLKKVEAPASMPNIN